MSLKQKNMEFEDLQREDFKITCHIQVQNMRLGYKPH